MKARKLAIAGAVEFVPTVYPDHRGMVAIPFHEDAFVDAVGHPLRVAQVNHSGSRAGVVRGVHFAEVPPGQAKFVYCPRGAVLDVVVDVRVGSPTFGQWEAHVLDDEKHRQLYVPVGFGHGFAVLSEVADVAYLVSSLYDPETEAGIAWDDPDVGVDWRVSEPLLSERDKSAPKLAEVAETLPF